MGASLTGMTGELGDSLDRTGGGIEGGLSARWPRSARVFGIQGELLLVSRERSFEDIAGFRRSLRVVYAQIPLLARASLGRSRKLRTYALAGPYLAWRLSSNIVPGEYVGDEPVNPADVRANDAGAIIGLGSDLGTGRGRGTIELRLGLGFVGVLEDRAGIGGAYRVLTLVLAFTPSE